MLETIVKPLRLGVPVVEVPTSWTARVEGESVNPFVRNFEYFRPGLRTRFMRREPPTVRQDRDEHDLTRDLAAELVGCEKTLSLLERLAVEPMAIFEFMPERAERSYRAYRKHFE